MSRLNGKVSGDLGDAVKDTRFGGLWWGWRTPGNKRGILIDGAEYPLEGEPPVAKTNGWGRVPGTY